MTAEVLVLPGKGKRDPNAMLECAKTAGLSDVIIVGWDATGDFFLSASDESNPEILWLLALAQQQLMQSSG